MSLPFETAPRPWARDAADVAADLGSDPVRGLSGDEAAARLVRFGRNELVERWKKPTWRLLVEQFTNAMIIVLMVAAVITALLGDLKDTIVILAIVVLNGIVGFVQEYRAEQALDALKRMASPTARVVRDGETVLVPAPEVVPGDLVRLDAGDIVTADLRLLEARALRINEAALTGESEPAEKSTEPLPDVPEGVLADQRNVAFNGTAVTYGRGAGVVLTTGMSTSLGRVAELLQEHAGGQTPLQKRLGALGKALAGLAFVVCALVFATGVARGESPEEMFLVAVSLAVAAIPEGLPAVVTVALALGARRMARRSALVRKLPGGRDARVGHRHLLGQDGHAHREPDARRARLDAVRLLRHRRRRVRAGRGDRTRRRGAGRAGLARELGGGRGRPRPSRPHLGGLQRRHAARTRPGGRRLVDHRRPDGGRPARLRRQARHLRLRPAGRPPARGGADLRRRPAAG